MVVYRGVMLYGDSGAGKSSLINAGLFDAARLKGFQPERIRVQPRSEQELVVERVALDEAGTAYLPSLFETEDDAAPHVVLSADAFAERLRVGSLAARPLLVFDQFEELVTLFEETGARELQQRIVDLLILLLRSVDLPAKVLLVFREDYLARVKQLLEAVPELVDQALRLTPPRAEELMTIIRGPFEHHRFERELSPELAETLRGKLADRFGSGEVSLSEVQTVCLRLWQAEDPEALLRSRGIQGLLEDYLGEELERFPNELRYAAVALLSQMVTSAGTRSVVSAQDLIERVRDEEKIPAELLERALERLEGESKLVRRERRRDLYLYEITSEFLVPWISRRRQELVGLRKTRTQRRRRLLVGSFAGFFALVAVLGSLGFWALKQRNDAEAAEKNARQAETEASSLVLAFSSTAQLESRLDASLILGLAGYRLSDRPETRSSVISALEAAKSSPAMVILRGHDGSIRSVAVSGDDRMLASGGIDRTIVLWNVPTHKQLGRLRAHATISSLAFSPDGQTLASGGKDGAIRLWDVATRRQRGKALKAGKSVLALAFSPDGRMLASGSHDGLVHLWDTQARTRVRQLPAGDGYAVWSLAFSPNGRRLIAGSAERCERRPFKVNQTEGTLSLWDVQTSKELTHYPDYGGGCAVALSRDGTKLASAGTGGRVTLWSVRTKKWRGETLGNHRGTVGSLAFSPDGRLLASAGPDSPRIRLWDVRSRKQLRQPLVGHAFGVHAVTFTPSGQMLASAGDEGTVRLWSVTGTRLLGDPLRGSTGYIGALAFSSAHRLVSGGGGHFVRVWDTAARKQVDPPMRSDSDVFDLVVSRDGRTVASGGRDGSPRVWSLSRPSKVGYLGTGQSSYADIWAVALSPDGHTLASGGTDNEIRLWDLRTRPRLPHVLKGHTDAVRDLAFSPDGRKLASASFDGTVRLWDVKAGKQIGAAFGKQPPYVFGVAFSPDGRTLASAGGDGTVQLWNVHTRRPLGQPLRGHTGFVYSVAFSPDGLMLASGGLDRTIRLWDVGARKPLGKPLRAQGAVYAVAFSPDGSTLVSGGKDRGVQLWEGILWRSPDQLRKRICDLVVGDLTPAEWRNFVPGIHHDPGCP